jgi:hypothetical protein
MNFEGFVGQEFSEKEFYELLVFEVETHFGLNFKKGFHFYFDRITSNRIKITELVLFDDIMAMDRKDREMIEKKEWFEVEASHESYHLIFCRLDRSGFVSSIYCDGTRTQESCLSWANEGGLPSPPMTPDEMTLAFMELAGVLEADVELQNSKSKKAV